jgi:hypothetical protein
MSKLTTRPVAVAIAVLLLGAGDQAVSAQQGPRSFGASLHGFEEVPAVSSTGSGRFAARLVDGGNALEYTLSYDGLEGSTTTGAHIHLGQAGVNGGVAAFLCGGAAPACPAGGGTVSGVIAAADVIGPAGQGIDPGEFHELLRAMRAGATYVNVHTDKHMGGEIRGQVR